MTSGAATPPNDAGIAEPDRTPSDADVAEQINTAAADLEALTAELDDCTDVLDKLEQTLDTMLDDPSLEVMVVDGELRIQAVSKGMSERLADGEPPVGRALEQVAPPEWGNVVHLLSVLPDDDAWHPHHLAVGALHVRRATDADTDPVFVLRLDR